MLRDPAFLIDRRKCLSVDLFPSDSEKAIVALTLDHFDTYASAPDDVVIQVEMEKAGMEADDVDLILEDYYQKPKQVRYVRDKVLEFAQKRNLELAIERMAGILDDADFEELRAELLQAAFFADEENSPGSVWSEGMRDRLKRYKEDERPGTVTTGLAVMDEHLEGGLAPTELGVILAAPNTGKTTMLVNLGKAAMMTGRRVIHYTLEMGTASVERRYDMSILNVTKKELRTKQGTVWKKMKKLVDSKLAENLMVKSYPMHKATPATLEAHLDLIAQRDGFSPDLIIVDYGALLRSARKYDAKRFEIASVFQDMHAMASERYVPLWSAHQTNRDGLKTAVAGMGDLGECFEVGPIADVIVSLNMTETDKRRGICKLHWAKNRENPSGMTEIVKMDYARASVRDFEDA